MLLKQSCKQFNYIIHLFPVSIVTLSLIPMVKENNGIAEVCIAVVSPNISCPVTFPFEFNVHANDGTAGMYILVGFSL